MDLTIYKDLLTELRLAAGRFEGPSEADSEALEEDFSEILESIDINKWSTNTDGTVKSIDALLREMAEANRNLDKQKCIESISMIRVALSDIESSFSNTLDSMEKLVLSIRDA